MIAILDYGMGNLRSVEKALVALGENPIITTTIPANASRLIIPGVGAFGAAMERLAPIRTDIRAFAAAGHPIFGICLGQQLLFESSEEHGTHSGLGLLEGHVRYLPRDQGLKVPHMGWSPVVACQTDGIMTGLHDGVQVYFVHSLFTACNDPDDIAATAEYGVQFAAAVRRKNVWGAQFHPEKSGEVGLTMLRSFLNCS